MTYCVLLDSPQVYDIFHAKEFHQEYVFVVLKTGEVVIWMFRKPEYTWKLAKRYSLCKGRDSQIVSYAYDKHTRALLWCEKRSASQFCICKANLKFPEGSARNNNSSSPEQATVAFEDVKAILHNCLPMNIYALSHKVFIFLPVSNKPQGLFMFWSNETDKIVVSTICLHELHLNTCYEFKKIHRFPKSQQRHIVIYRM